MTGYNVKAADQLVVPDPGPPRFRPMLNSVVLRDQLHLSTWILLGGISQAFLSLLPISRRYTIAPVLVLGAVRLVGCIRDILTWKPEDDGAIMHKFGASFEEDEKSDGGVVVLLLKFRINSPKGLFTPGLGEIGPFFVDMINTLNASPDEYDFLGGSSNIGSSAHGAANESVGVYYFRTMPGLQKFAHSTLHAKAWQWWHANADRLGGIGIAHEVFEAPAGSWEAIYAHYPPSGIMQTSFAVEDPKTGEKRYRSPIVDARKSRYRTSMGRMGRTQGDENGLDGNVPYAAGEKA